MWILEKENITQMIFFQNVFLHCFAFFFGCTNIHLPADASTVVKWGQSSHNTNKNINNTKKTTFNRNNNTIPYLFSKSKEMLT